LSSPPIRHHSTMSSIAPKDFYIPPSSLLCPSFVPAPSLLSLP
jgi:hypothetical protein